MCIFRRRAMQAAADEFYPLRTFVARNVEKKLRNWYGRRAWWVRHFFRWSGFFLIAFSVSLPFVSVLEFGGDTKAKTITLSALSVIIAFLTGIRGFFRWDQVWRIMRKTERELTFNLLDWRLGLPRLAGPRGTAAAGEAGAGGREK